MSKPLINDNTILIRLAYAEDITESKRFDGNTYYYDVPIKNELKDINEEPMEYDEIINEETYRIKKTKKIYILDSLNVPVKKMSANKYLQGDQYDEDGPIRGWILLDLISKYGSENLAKYKYPDPTIFGNTSNVFVFDVTKNLNDDDPKKQLRKFIFTTYGDIRKAADEAELEIEQINTSLDENEKLVYKAGILQEGYLGSLMPPPKTNDSEINFIGKVNFLVHQLEIFNEHNELETNQKLYDHVISKHYKFDDKYGKSTKNSVLDKKTIKHFTANLDNSIEKIKTVTGRSSDEIKKIYITLLYYSDNRSTYIKDPKKLARLTNNMLKKEDDKDNLKKKIFKTINELQSTLGIKNEEIDIVIEKIERILMGSRAEGKTKKRRIKKNINQISKKPKKQRTKNKTKRKKRNKPNKTKHIKKKQNKTKHKKRKHKK